VNWFVFALIANLLFVVYTLLGRVLSIKSKNPRAFSVVYNLTCFLIAFLNWLVTRPAFSLNVITPSVLFLTFSAIILWGLFCLLEFYAYKYTEASLSAVLFKTADVIALVIATIFLKEILTSKKILAAVFILGASVLILYQKKKIEINNRGLIYTLLTSVFLGIAWDLDKILTNYYPTSFYVWLVYLFPGIFVYSLSPLSFADLKKEIDLASWKLLLLCLANVSAYYFLVRALALGEASKVVLITSSGSILVVLLGIIFLKERTHILKKLAAAVIVSIGILLLK